MNQPVRREVHTGQHIALLSTGAVVEQREARWILLLTPDSQ